MPTKKRKRPKARKPLGLEPLSNWAERASVIDREVRSILNLYGDPWANYQIVSESC